MGSCVKCCISWTILCVWLAFTCALAALFAPTWVSFGQSSNTSSSTGIFLICRLLYSRNVTCELYDVRVSDTPASLLAVKITWPVATSLLLFCAVGACRVSWFPALRVVCYLAFALIVACVVVFGIKFPEDSLGLAADLDLFDRDLDPCFDWGFYLAITAGGLALLTFTSFNITICCLKNSKKC